MVKDEEERQTHTLLWAHTVRAHMLMQVGKENECINR